MNPLLYRLLRLENADNDDHIVSRYPGVTRREALSLYTRALLREIEESTVRDLNHGDREQVTT